MKKLINSRPFFTTGWGCRTTGQQLNASDLCDILQHSSHFSCFITATADTIQTTLEKRQSSVRMISEGGSRNLQPETQKVRQTKQMERSDRAVEEGSVDRQTERQELPLSFQRERK